MTTPLQLSAFSFLLCAFCTSCTLAVDVQRASGSRYSGVALLGTDAAEVSREGSWKMQGVNNSNAAGVAKSAAITNTALRKLTPAVTKTAGQAIDAISR